MPRVGIYPAWESSLIPNRNLHPAIERASQFIWVFLQQVDMSAFTHGPREESRFESEKQRLPQSARVGNGTILAHAQVVCQFRLLAALDFMSGIASLMDAAKSVYSVFPLSRAVIENAAYVSWILEPDISAEQRACRGALDHRASAKESLKNLRQHRQSGLTEDLALQADAGIAQLAANLDSIQRDLSVARDSLPPNTKEQYPSKRRVVDDAVAAFSSQAGVGDIHYGYLSDMAHGGITGLLNLHQGAGMMEDFNVRVDRFLLPVAMAVTTLRPCLARIAESWSLQPADDDMQQVLEVLLEGYRNHSSEPAFQRASGDYANSAEPCSEG